MVNNTVYHIAGSSLWIEIFLKKREDQKKGALNRGLGHLCTLYIGIPGKFYAKPDFFFINFW